MGVDTSRWPYFCSFFRSYSAMFGGGIFEGLWESRDFPSLSQKSDLIFSSAGEKRSWVTGTPMTQIKVFAEALAPQNCSPWAFYPISDPFITDVGLPELQLVNPCQSLLPAPSTKEHRGHCHSGHLLPLVWHLAMSITGQADARKPLFLPPSILAAI